MKITNFIFPIDVVLVFQQQEDILPEIVGDILEPAPLPFTFETIGWQILGALLLILATLFFYKWYVFFCEKGYRREAIKKIQLLEINNWNSQAKINHIMIILKQVAIVTFGREQVAKLYGNDWFSFLDSKSKKSDFAKYSNNFIDAIYSNKTVDKSTLRTIYKLAKTWIHEHS